MLLNCGVGEDSWESLGQQGDPTSPSYRKSVLNIHWKDWYWSWNSNILATWCEELTHWKRPWCWERLKMRGERDDRGWDSWMASLTQWTWVWASSRWWRTGKPGVLQSMGPQIVTHNWATDIFHKIAKIGLPWVRRNPGLICLASFTSLGWPHGAFTEHWAAGSRRGNHYIPMTTLTLMEQNLPCLLSRVSGWRPSSQGPQEQRPKSVSHSLSSSVNSQRPIELPYFNTSAALQKGYQETSSACIFSAFTMDMIRDLETHFPCSSLPSKNQSYTE